MKTLNFSCLEILSALLNKSKTQTIGPAWETKILDRNYKCGECGREGQLEGEYDKPPCFKVGDKVKLFWKQGSKYKEFCEYCGNGFKGHRVQHICNESSGLKVIGFNKHLGIVEIVEVFKINLEIIKIQALGNIKRTQFLVYTNKNDLWTKEKIRDLAKRDGFSSAEQMFKTIDKMYDLSSSKKFWVYRWQWVCLDVPRTLLLHSVL